MKYKMIDQILYDFEHKQMPQFYNLLEYETDYEISKHVFKMLHIGYIKKEDVDNPTQCIDIIFKKNKFWIDTKQRMTSRKVYYLDYYINYTSLDSIYQKIMKVCKDIEDKRNEDTYWVYAGDTTELWNIRVYNKNIDFKKCKSMHTQVEINDLRYGVQSAALYSVEIRGVQKLFAMTEVSNGHYVYFEKYIKER
ncbi:MAG: hypothetical protein K2J85_03010 [Anaeroplasmataceae bacterium]|nr:hypothetical protein [Anaeroplasmataceae bacterium]